MEKDDLILEQRKQKLFQTKRIDDLKINQSSSSVSSQRKPFRHLTEKPIDPIQVLSDGQEKQIITQIYQEEVYRAKIEQAKLTKSKYQILKVLYKQYALAGKNQNDKQKKFRQVVKGYVSKNLKNSKGQDFDMRNSHFCEAIVAKLDQKFIESEYMLFGCDLLSQKNIQKMFKQYSPSIKWLNSSHCKLTFQQKIKGWSSVVDNIKEKNIEEFKKQLKESIKVENLMGNLQIQEQIEQQMQQHQQIRQCQKQFFEIQKLKKQYHLLRSYIQLAPYYELNFKRRLMIRNVTQSEQKLGYNLDIGRDEVSSNKNFQKKSIIENGKESDYKKYLNVKQRLWNQIQNQSIINPQYQKILKEIEEEADTLNYSRRKRPKNQTLGQYKNYNCKKPFERGSNFQQSHSNRQHYYKPNEQDLQYQQNSYYKKNLNRRQNETYEQNNVPGKEYDQFEYRNRSRDIQYQRGFQRGKGSGSYRGQNFNSNQDRMYKNKDIIQNSFDKYIQKRDGLKFIQNLQKNSDPVFIDRNTGIPYYQNPNYNSSTQTSHPTNFYAYNPQGYNNQSYINQNSQSYQYQGNQQSQYQRQSPQSLNPRGGFRGNQLYSGMDSNRGSYSNPNNSKFQQFTPPIRNHVQQNFSNYCNQRQLNKNINAQEKQIKNKQIIIEKVPQRTEKKSQNKYGNINPQPILQKIFESDLNFSIISENNLDLQKNNFPQQQNYNINTGDLQNILDKINSEEGHHQQYQSHYSLQCQGNIIESQPTNHYDQESSDLQFILQQNEGKKYDDHIKLEHDSKKIPNSSNFIEEKIPIENVPKWINNQKHKLISGLNSVYNNSLSSKNQSQFLNQGTLEKKKEQSVFFSEQIITKGELKKKVPNKKRNEESKSKSKHQHGSLSKKSNV